MQVPNILGDEKNSDPFFKEYYSSTDSSSKEKTQPGVKVLHPYPITVDIQTETKNKGIGLPSGKKKEVDAS